MRYYDRTTRKKTSWLGQIKVRCREANDAVSAIDQMVFSICPRRSIRAFPGSVTMPYKSSHRVKDRNMPFQDATTSPNSKDVIATKQQQQQQQQHHDRPNHPTNLHPRHQPNLRMGHPLPRTNIQRLLLPYANPPNIPRPPPPLGRSRSHRAHEPLDAVRLQRSNAGAYGESGCFGGG